LGKFSLKELSFRSMALHGFERHWGMGEGKTSFLLHFGESWKGGLALRALSWIRKEDNEVMMISSRALVRSTLLFTIQSV
jgi:hypothetical protein